MKIKLELFSLLWWGLTIRLDYCIKFLVMIANVKAT